MQAIKSVSQAYAPSEELQSMMETFKDMVNHCIRIGLENDVSTMQKLSLLSYERLHEYKIPSYSKLSAISQASGRLTNMKRSIKKGVKTKSPFIRRPYLVSCYGFKISGLLLSIPVGKRSYANLVLNCHTLSQIEGMEPRSFMITPTSLSISIRKEVEELAPENMLGIDRNLRNITMCTKDGPIMYRTEKHLSIQENTSHVQASFKRYDIRVKKFYQRRLGNRRSRRTQQFLHKISKDIVQRAKETKSMIVFEDLKGIRKLYRKGNGQGNRYRRRLNSWSFYELQRQVEYKANWDGIPVRYVDPKRTSKLCPICGERIQEDHQNQRKLLCINCGRIMDRDVVAAMIIAHKGWARFTHLRGLPDEAVKGNVDNLQPLILRVDGSKLVSGFRSR